MKNLTSGIEFFPRQHILPILLLLGLAFQYSPSISQTQADQAPPPEGPEQFYARSDRPYYILGEHVWYQVYAFFQNSNLAHSRIVYAEIIDPTGEIVLQQKLKFNQLTASGDFQLETHWNPGWYRIRVYSKWNQNFSPPAYYSHSILVLNIPNDSESFASQSILNTKTLSSSSYQISGQQGIKLTLNKEVFAPRETISLDIRLDNPANSPTSANVSVSVVQLGYFGESLQSQPSLKDLKERPASSFEKTGSQAIPEDRFQVPFRLSDADGQPVTSSFIEGIIHQSGKVNYTKSINGEGIISFGEVYDKSTIQFFDPNPFDIHPRLKVRLVEQVPDLPALSPDMRAFPDYQEIQAYQQRYVQDLILDKLYNTSSVFALTPTPTPYVERTPDLTIEIDDFIQFEDIFHFLGEAVLSVQIKKPPKRFKSVITFSKGPHEGEMFIFPIYSQGNFTEPQQLQYVVPVMFSVNDYLFYDPDLLLDVEWKNVEAIQLYRVLETLQFQFGPAGKSGIMGMVTRDRKTPPSIVNAAHNMVFQGFHIPESYPNPLYESEENETSKIPDFRPVNYWSSNIFVPPLGSANEVNFSAIDATGWYLIRIEGVSSTGEPVWAEKRFQVRLPSE